VQKSKGKKNYKNTSIIEGNKTFYIDEDGSVIPLRPSKSVRYDSPKGAINNRHNNNQQVNSQPDKSKKRHRYAYANFHQMDLVAEEIFGPSRNYHDSLS